MIRVYYNSKMRGNIVSEEVWLPVYRVRGVIDFRRKWAANFSSLERFSREKEAFMGPVKHRELYYRGRGGASLRDRCFPDEYVE